MECWPRRASVRWALVAGLAVPQLVSAASPTSSGYVSAAVTLRVGQSLPLYVLSGRLSGPIGTFVVSCSARGQPHTRYVVTRSAADTLVAMDGRGASRGAVLASERPALDGGAGISGLEHWIVRMGREPEEVTLDATLYAVATGANPTAGAPPAFCTFGLAGTARVVAH